MSPKNLPPLFNLWTILGSFACAGLLLIATWIGIGWAHPHSSATAGFVAADLTVIPLPTATLRVPTPTTDASLAASLTAQPNQISLNSYVQISGTGTDGLRIRSAPGLNSDTVFRGEESETFIVKDGPRQADGYTWWYLVAPYDSTRAGWAAADFLAVVPSP
ncbi:MAG TPA: SH3 domain-containing protein [Anaerolineales bacterium]|nr:SH3 domain-containing protein [Anaerolineales bacterium]